MTQTTEAEPGEGLTLKQIQQMKEAMLASVASMFEEVEYDQYGYAMNPVTVEWNRTFTRLPLRNGGMCAIPTALKLTLRREPTAEEMAKNLEKAVLGLPPYGSRDPEASVSSPLENMRIADASLPRDLVSGGYGEVYEHRRALLERVTELEARLRAATERDAPP